MAYWLFKSEPACFSFADLLAAPGRTTGWDGVRNYQARNLLRDEMKVGDGVCVNVAVNVGDGVKVSVAVFDGVRVTDGV